jgi:hypothetical protein
LVWRVERKDMFVERSGLGKSLSPGYQRYGRYEHEATTKFDRII